MRSPMSELEKSMKTKTLAWIAAGTLVKIGLFVGLAWHGATRAADHPRFQARTPHGGHSSSQLNTAENSPSR